MGERPGDERKATAMEERGGEKKIEAVRVARGSGGKMGMRAGHTCNFRTETFQFRTETYLRSVSTPNKNMILPNRNMSSPNTNISFQRAIHVISVQKRINS